MISVRPLRDSRVISATPVCVIGILGGGARIAGAILVAGKPQQDGCNMRSRVGDQQVVMRFVTIDVVACLS